MNKPTIRNKIRNKFTKVRTLIIDDFNKQPTDEDLKTITRHKNHFMAYFYQYALGAIVAGFAVQPLIKFANPFAYMSSGMFLSLTIIVVYRLLVVSSVNTWISRKWNFVLMSILLIVNLILFSITMNNARNASANHDLYCQDIQHLIERGTDSEKNSTIFNNMQCRFQSND